MILFIKMPDQYLAYPYKIEKMYIKYSIHLTLMHQQSKFKLIYKSQIWSSYIKPILIEMTDQKMDSPSIIKNLQKLYIHFQFTGTYSKTNPKLLTLQILAQHYHQQLPQLFSDVAQFVLDNQHKQVTIPIFLSSHNVSHTFFKDQVVLMMCLMSLMLIGNKDSFEFIFSQEPWKTKAIMQYLKKQLTDLSALKKQYPQQAQFKSKLSKLTIKRKIIKDSLNKILLQKGELKMIQPSVAHDKQSIQDFYGDSKVDFANKFIGGGSLQTGCVQEEIMFVNHPELYISMPICQVMHDNQAIQFIGFKKYFKNTGYAWTCAFDGEETKQYQYDSQKRAKEYIVAIDALAFVSQSSSLIQFDKQLIDREIIKAYTGFLGSEGNNIVTGNWGCGAFNGNIPLKFMIQWIASSLAGKKMVYVPFGYREKVKNDELFNALKNEKVKKVYDDMIQLGGKIKDIKMNIMEELRKARIQK